ncbi:hypothetical protein MAE02_23120 [Microvirga aerophila]|uniref:Glycosyl transferase n=2 Tax=Microvirga aerophila TaxID=670291 RepID=A0A512BRI4_9HYPH|nr:hypothetical protein MAE02_23120 [Microvirga aerophila]
MAAEVPILRSLGWEVYVPKIIPHNNPEYRSGGVTYEYDAALQLHPAALAILNQHDFYHQAWSATVTEILNKNFDVLIAGFSYYTLVLSEAAKKFNGLICARAFGREYPRTYADFDQYGMMPGVLAELDRLGSRFVFAQGYENLAEIEPEALQRHAQTVGIPLPKQIFHYEGIWKGGGENAIFLCPSITTSAFYQEIYKGIKESFSYLPHIIFGKQSGNVNDPCVLPYLSDSELVELYENAPVFVYPHTEPRHVHYSPLEAMVVGTPVLYLKDALIDRLSGNADVPGRCDGVEEMQEKAMRLVRGDKLLAERIRSNQSRVIDRFSIDRAKKQWLSILTR